MKKKTKRAKHQAFALSFHKKEKNESMIDTF